MQDEGRKTKDERLKTGDCRLATGDWELILPEATLCAILEE